MATPMVSGAAALIKQAHPNWTPQQIKDAIKTGATPLSNEWDLYAQGSGRINLFKSIVDCNDTAYNGSYCDINHTKICINYQCAAEFEDCNIPGDDNANGLADCEDPACKEETLCNYHTGICINSQCITRPSESEITPPCPYPSSICSNPSSYPPLWLGIRISSDGGKVTILADHVYISYDYGNSWIMKLGNINAPWMDVSMSSDGSKIVIPTGGGNWARIYFSSDFGTTWTAKGPSEYWTGTWMSSDGNKVLALTSDGKLYTTNDFGETWNYSTAIPSFKFVVLSSDAEKLALVKSDGEGIYFSNDYGTTWVKKTPADKTGWKSLAASSDGTKFIAIQGLNISVSSDSGETWTTTGPTLTSRNYGWQSVASSADGSKYVVGSVRGKAYYSQNSGEDWFPLMTSDDFIRDVAISEYGKIYTIDNTLKRVYSYNS